jgi:hypothetical protein
MRWLFIALLISIIGLLLAVTGTARHILRRGKLEHQTSKGDAAVANAPETSDVESES